MSADQSPAAVVPNTGYELFVSALSVLSLVNIVLVLLIPDPATQNIVYSIDVVLSVVFMIDFLVMLRRAPSRSKYFFRQFGWADLLGSLPLPQVKILRIFRVLRGFEYCADPGQRISREASSGIAHQAHC